MAEKMTTAKGSVLAFVIALVTAVAGFLGYEIMVDVEPVTEPLSAQETADVLFYGSSE